ncbi:MAG: NADH-quinone oxidoreductase subunit J [Candidatus Micrarchaeia archaeon]
MILLLMFYCLAALGFFIATFVFSEKSVYKAAIALALVFTVSSLIILLSSQVFLAVLQLLIMVGGIGTYLIVAVASETESEKRHAGMATLFAVFAVIAALLVYSIVGNPAGAGAVVQNINSEIQGAFSTYYLLFYLIIFLMFSAAIGSVVLLKRIVNIVT